jgi:hypothetical protein
MNVLVYRLGGSPFEYQSEISVRIELASLTGATYWRSPDAEKLTFIGEVGLRLIFRGKESRRYVIS